MKKVLSLVLAALMVCGCVLLASCGESDDKKEILNVYTNAGFAPYEYLNDKGEAVGVDIDVIKYIGEKLGYDVRINDIEFNQILNEVAKDKLAVGAAGMTKKPDRDAVALASNIYATSIQYVIAPKGAFTGEKIAIEDVVAYVATQSGKAIGVQKGTTGADMAASACEETDVSAVEYTNAVIASNDIGTVVGAVIIDKMPAEAICKDKTNLQCWALDADTESYVMYFNLEATDLVNKVNEILDQMIKDGKIEEFTVAHSN